MRTLFVACFLVSFVSIASSQQDQWERIGAVQFTSVARQSAFKLYVTTSHGYLYSSTDKGNSWSGRRLDDTLNLVDIAFVDSLHGVIIDHYSNVLLTSDGGDTWSYKLLPQFSIANRVAYPSLDSIFICDSLGKVWRSIDRGNSWKVVYQSAFGENPEYALQSIFFRDSKNGFVVGAKGILLKTLDGGEHWSEPIKAIGDSIPLFCIDFYNKDVGVVAGLNYVFTTIDGGENWIAHRLQDSVKNILFTIRLTSDHDFFAFGPSGQVYLSSDFGKTIRVPLIDAEEFSTVNGSIFNSGEGAFVVGGAGLILFSGNGKDWVAKNQCTGGGTSWNGGYTTTLFFVGVHFNSRDTGFVIQQTGDCKKTANGGKTWQPLNLSIQIPKNGFIGSAFKNEVGYVYSAHSIVRTSDNGTTWLRADPILDSTTPFAGKSVPLFWSFLSVQVGDQKFGVATMSVSDSIINPSQSQSRYGNYHSQLYFTTNDGISWDVMKTAPSLPRSRTVHFKNRMTGYLGCDSNTLYRTFDGGITWQRIKVGSVGNSIRTINFLNDTIGFLSMNNDVFSTSDGGASWTKEEFRMPVDFPKPAVNMFIFPDSSTVIARDNTEKYYRKVISPQKNTSVRNNFFSHAQESDILVFPQPAHRSVHCIFQILDGTSRSPIKAGLYDVLGREVFDLSTIANSNRNSLRSEFDLDTNMFSPGIYTISFIIGKRAFSKQITIF